jgi:[ribosomal protein S18]-alanine N-acetyltransferase
MSPELGPAPPLVLERMRWWDLAQVHDLETQLFADQPWSLGQLWSELARVPQTRWYVVARRDDAIVGYAGLFAVPPEADVQTIAVVPTEQGHGLGGRLLDALLAEAARRGVRQVHLEVRADNAAAQRLYERAGFLADGRRRDYYGRGQDAVLMTRLLPGGDDG